MNDTNAILNGNNRDIGKRISAGGPREPPFWPSPGLRSRSSGDVTVPAGLDALEVDSSFGGSFSSIMNISKNPDYLIMKLFKVQMTSSILKEEQSLAV
jgi:hypothetical protein